ncbi:MAG TPA: SDR family NAD(P)-dependent oxidoreductase [Pseudonocardiaceae bacterium]|jgi:NAD(P)-dependent dehydrogenase (short-subunit alcohol dehydrogenase family)
MTAPDNHSGRLDGRRAVLVGAGQQPGATVGIGRAIALVLAARGADLVLVDKDESGARETQRLLAVQGHTAEIRVADITDPASCAAFADSLGKRCDVLVNSVGILGDGTALNTEEMVWDRVMDVNLKGMWRLTKALLPLMIARRTGSIVNVSSIGANGGPNLAYGISKAGVNRFTLALAAEYAKFDIRANAVLPGLVDTPMSVEGGLAARGLTRDEYVARRAAMVPMAYQGTAFDVARAVAFFASDDSRYVSGALMPVDGALVASSW